MTSSYRQQIRHYLTVIDYSVHCSCSRQTPTGSTLSCVLSSTVYNTASKGNDKNFVESMGVKPYAAAPALADASPRHRSSPANCRSRNGFFFFSFFGVS